MRTLQIYSGNLYGGVERTLTMIARHGGGFDTTREFALCFDGRLSRELAAMRSLVHPLGEVRIRRPLTVWRARRRLARLLAREHYDVVICHSAWSQAIFGPVIRQASIPSVFWLHDVITGRHWLERWARRVTPNLVICNSHFTALSAAKMYPGVPFEVLHPPVTPPQPPRQNRRALRQSLETGEHCSVIVQVSRLERLKGHANHLEALALLRDATEPWACWFVGGVQRPKEAVYLAELQKTAARLGIADRVRFLGQRSDVPALLGAADVYCQPNVTPEAFGISFVEALAAGLPVVTTSMGGALEILDSSCGILVPPHDPTAVAGVLRRLIEDPVLRAEIGKAGPARARKLCDPTTQVTRLDGILRAVAAAS